MTIDGSQPPSFFSDGAHPTADHKRHVGTAEYVSTGKFLHPTDAREQVFRRPLSSRSHVPRTLPQSWTSNNMASTFANALRQTAADTLPSCPRNSPSQDCLREAGNLRERAWEKISPSPQTHPGLKKALKVTDKAIVLLFLEFRKNHENSRDGTGKTSNRL